MRRSQLNQTLIYHVCIGSPPQFYISCAQIKVTGGGSGNPSPTVKVCRIRRWVEMNFTDTINKIPGHVKSTDSGYTANIYNNFNSYVVPGPKVATY
jgi:hypothetical protein